MTTRLAMVWRMAELCIMDSAVSLFQLTTFHLRPFAFMRDGVWLSLR